MLKGRASNSTDRMLLNLFVASLLHAAIIFGVVFSKPESKASRQSLEITLAQYKSEKEPEDADFIAQANQEGSGDLEEKALLSTTEVAEFKDNVIRDVQPVSQKPIPKPISETTKDILTTSGQSARSIAQRLSLQENQEIAEQVPDNTLEIMQQNADIASLEAQLRELKQAHAKRPRKRQLTAVSTKAAKDAAYLDAWRSKIETLGNIQYPKLNIANLYGDLRLMVAVNADGTIRGIRILKTSGNKRLDDAAIKVVRMAAPFDPFPDEIREDTDVLEIIRTWRFEKGSYLSSS